MSETTPKCGKPLPAYPGHFCEGVAGHIGETCKPPLGEAPRFIRESQAPAEVRVPLNEPLPLGRCPNVVPPAFCGFCWYCITYLAGLKVDDVLAGPVAVEKVVRRGALGGRKR